MKYLFTLLLSLAMFRAKTEETATISGKIIGGSTTLSVFYSCGEFTFSDNIVKTQNGSFRYTLKRLGKPYFAVLGVANLAPVPLFVAPGYNLFLDIDLSRKTVRISGKGSVVNQYNQEMIQRWIVGKDREEWNKGEAAFLRSLRDSINAIASFDRAFADATTDTLKNHFKEVVIQQREQKMVRHLYRFASKNRYSLAQTDALFVRAGIEEPRAKLRQRPLAGMLYGNDFRRSPRKGPMTSRVFFGDHRYEKRLSLDKEHFIQLRYENGINIRFEQGTGAEIYEGNLVPRGGKRPTPSVLVDGACSVEFVYPGITRANAKDFRFHIVQGKQDEIADWKSPDDFRVTQDGKVPYAYLARIPFAPGKLVTIEVYHVSNARRLDAFVVDWRKVQPANISFDAQFTSKRFRKNLLNAPFDGPIDYTTPDFVVAKSPDVHFRLSDSLQQLQFRLNNPSDAYRYAVILKRKTRMADDVIRFDPTNQALVLQKPLWNEPGEYEISFTPRLVKHGGSPVKLLSEKSTVIKFTVLPALDSPKLISRRDLVIILVSISSIVLSVLIILRSLHNRRIGREKVQKDQLALQLGSVRAQLNPHFLYNALAGIQNLVNKNDIDNANLYLSKFARITRSILEEGQDTVTLREEMKLVDDYLSMEKLRFPFDYEITAGAGIDPDNTSIPAMLLQPFVENAVKHGVAGKDDGKITVRFDRHGKSLFLRVSDNGSGFDAGKVTGGAGNRLSTERIALFNKLYRETPLKLVVSSNENGTLISIELTEWL